MGYSEPPRPPPRAGGVRNTPSVFSRGGRLLLLFMLTRAILQYAVTLFHRLGSLVYTADSAAGPWTVVPGFSYSRGTGSRPGQNPAPMYHNGERAGEGWGGEGRLEEFLQPHIFVFRKTTI